MATNILAKAGVAEEEGLACEKRDQLFSSTDAMLEQWEVDHGEKEVSLTFGERLGLEDLYSLNVSMNSRFVFLSYNFDMV
ncbi:hypothetical protein HanIR_Chr10g0473771 [Helianthus annuus]|nr:hypothetical protein HanIR_Chr10g0473771 [Helianthus annuus]